MNPLFAAHIIADFLLQPSWLIEWKKKKVAGIAAHAVIHGVVISLLVLPGELSSILAVLGIAVAHGAIDIVKIEYQKRGGAFISGFLIDQLAHFAVLLIALPFIPSIVFWNTPYGIALIFLLFLLSFGVGAGNITKAWKKKQKITLVVALVFLVYFIAAQQAMF